MREKQVITQEYWENSLEKGEKAEVYFGKFLKSKGWKVEYTSGYNTDWDLTATKGEKKLTFEVKENGDPEKHRTCFVEVEQGEVDSGLRKTKADWQIHVSKASGAIKGMRTKDLKAYIGWQVAQGYLVKMDNGYLDRNGNIAGAGYRVDWNALTRIR